MLNRSLIFIVGPTATGKSETAVCLAKKINAEIISCDSMQVYKKMDIITSKPSKILSRQVRHHLIDRVSPTQEYNVSRYRQDALKKIKEIMRRGKTPLLVGGSGLYMSILIDGIFEGKAKQGIRRQLYRQAERFGSDYLYERLKEVDPQAAAKIHPHDLKRMVRALEVFKTTGEQISELQKQRKGLADEYAIKIFSLNMQRDKLYQRIAQRIERMFRKGLLPEVKKLLKLKLSKTACAAIGIKELKGYFAGLYDLAEAKQQMKRNTCLYAKRQLTWFRKDKRIEWVEVRGQDTPKQIAEKIWKRLY